MVPPDGAPERGVGVAERDAPARPLRIAALVKQIPVAEAMRLGPDGRLVREGAELELNAYCRRAVSQGVSLARDTAGSCTVFTLGPPSAEDVLREALAWGADRGVHLCAPEFAGSDTLATARALAAALRREGPFDLVLVGRNSLDGETGQVGPEVAELCDLAFVTGVRELELAGDVLHLRLELDDGWQRVTVAWPAVLSVAERLCEPCKKPPEDRAAVDPALITVVGPADLGAGPWGQDASPTVVGSVRTVAHGRWGSVLSGKVDEQVAQAVALLEERGALTAGTRRATGAASLAELAARSSAGPGNGRELPGAALVGVLIEPGRLDVGAELLGAAARLAAGVGGHVVAVEPLPAGGAGSDHRAPDRARLAAWGADRLLELSARGTPVPEDVADAVVTWCAAEPPWALLAPSTAFGREVAARVAAALGAGLVGDAVGVDVVDGQLVAAKPAFAGSTLADITCRSAVQLVTVRPGVLPPPASRPTGTELAVTSRTMGCRGRVTVHEQGRDDDVEILARADVVIGVGSGVPPEEYASLSALAAILGAEMAATRKVTDKGWAPRARQVGITGRFIAPRLYLAVGLSGKFNHMVGVRAAATVLAINADRTAPVFEYADIGIVGDWRAVVPALASALRTRLAAVG